MCSSYPKGVSKTNNPSKGDLIVFNWGTYGHVALITSVSGQSGPWLSFECPL
jgi:surface antigen